MKRTITKIIALILFIQLGVTQVNAQITNPGFESGLTGWTASSGVSNSGNITILNWTVLPGDNSMAHLTTNSNLLIAGAESNLGLTSGSLINFNTNLFGPNSPTAPTNFATLTQNITLAANQRITIYWNYVSRDYSPYNDGSVATLVGPSGYKSIKMLAVTDNAYSSGAIVTGSYGSTDWHTVTFIAGAAGTYRLGFATFNSRDQAVEPSLFIDNRAGGTSAPGEAIVKTTTATKSGCFGVITGGEVTSTGNATVTARGVCYNTTGSPTLSNSYTVNGSGLGTFVSTLSNLSPGTYYIRAYATNSVGTSYGSETSITIVDNVPPTALCRNLSLPLNSSGSVSLTAGQINNGSFDDCSGIKSLSINKTAFTCSNVGNNTVILSVTDNNNNVSTCQSTVNIFDPIPPNALCKNITVQLGSNGTATISASDIDNGSNDACGIMSLNINRSSFSCNDVGANLVTLTVRDNNNNVSTCLSTVTVEDKVAPVLKSTHNIINGSYPTSPLFLIENVNECESTAASYDPVSLESQVAAAFEDACGGQITATYSHTIPQNSPTNTNCNWLFTYFYKVKDQYGNFFDNNVEVVRYGKDQTAPVAICKPITISLNNGSASITPNDIDNNSYDNCSSVTLSVSKSTFGCSNVGANTVTLTVTDTCGNSTTCDAVVTVVDNTNPNAVCKNITVQLDNNGAATISASDIDNGSNDACGIKSLSIDKSSFDCSNVGANSVTLTVTDNNNNVSTCQSTVTVEDKVAPVAIAQNLTVYLDSTGNASITASQVNNGSSDACGINLSISKNTFNCSNVGSGGYPDQYALSFNNGDDYVVIGNVTPSNQSYTKEAWVYASSTSCDNIISSNQNPFWITGGKLSAGNGNVYSTVTDPNSFPANTWTHVAVTYDASSNTMRLYKNGNQVAVNTSAPANTGGINAIGKHYAGGCHFTGLINEVRIWNYARSASDLNTYKNKTLSGVETGLTAYYPMEEGSGSGTADVTGHGYNGTFSSMSSNPWVSGSGLTSGGNGNQVILTVTDANSNVSKDTAIITVVDDVEPTALCKNITIQLDANGNATISASDLDNGSNDACGIKSLHISKSTFNCSNLGSNTVMLKAIDNNNNSNVCQSIVTVQDNISPNANAKNITVYLDQTGKATITPNDIDNGSNDNCGIVSKSISNTTFGCNTANYALAFDGQNDHVKMPNGIVNGLKDFTFEAWVNYTDNGYWTRIMDIGINTTYNMFLTPKAGRAPNVGRPRLAITTGGIGGEQLIDANIAMPTGWHHIAVTLDHDPSTSNVVGKMYIDGTLVGQNNNMTRTPSDLGVTTQNLLGKSQYNDPYFKQYMDEVRIWSVARTQSQIQNSMSQSLSGSEYGLFVYYDFEDGPNSSTVNDKSPSNNDGTLVNMNTSTAFISPGVINTLGTGNQNVVLTVGDASSNYSSDTAVVTVVDSIKPNLTTNNYTLVLNASGQGTISVENVVSAYSDNCEVAKIELSKKNFDCNNVGQNSITVTATDVNNNSTSVTVVVTVVDNSAPTAICKNITVQLDNNGAATITASDVNDGSNDACGIKSLSIDKSSFDCTNVGANTVTLTVTDNNNNVSTCQSTVTVEDKVAPTAICKNITVQLDNNGTATITASDVNDGSNDACGIKSLSIDKSSFDCTHVGANTVTLTVTDNNNNVSTCQSTVTVEDKVAPTAICKNITVQLDNNGTATITASDVNDGSNDACGIKSLSIDKSSFDCTNVGANTVTLTVTDNNNNVSTCQSTVTIEDKVAPTAICKNITVQLNNNGTATITASDVNDGSNDACGIKSLSIDKSSFECTNVGANTVTLTVTDNNNNVSTCQSTVTVEDNVAPVAVAQNVTLTLSGGAASVTATQVDNGSSDACGIKSMTVSPSSFDCSNIGANTVTLTVTDNNNNVSTATASVTVIGTIPTCNLSVTPSNNTYTGGVATNLYLGYGPQSVTITSTPAGGSSFSYSWSGSYLSGSGNSVTFSPTAGGNYTIECTVTNEYGCSYTCSVTICVKDIRAGGSGKNQKVYLCHVPPGNPNNPQTLSISISAVPSHLGQHSGDALGACNQSCNSTKRAEDYQDNVFVSEGMTVMVYPNPSESQFSFEVESDSDEEITISLVDLTGKLIVEMKEIVPHQIVQLGSELPSGVYMAHVKQGDRVEVIRIAKTR